MRSGGGRSCPLGPPSVGLVGQFFGRGILESNGNWLLLVDNYNRTTNDPTTEAQSAQRTHRDDLLTKVRDHSPVWQFLQATGSSARQPASSIVGGVPAAPPRSLPLGRPVQTTSPFPRRARMNDLRLQRTAGSRPVRLGLLFPQHP